MKAWTASLCVVALVTMAMPATAATLSPREVLDRVDDVWRGDSSHGIVNMTVVTEHWKRTLGLEMWSLGKDKSLIRILSPQKEKGTATLKSDKNIWNYLPKVKRVIKVPSSMMGGSWMGSHFTNDDLVRESRMADDYTFQTTFEGDREGEAVIELTLTPKPDAPVVWGKVQVTVRTKDWMPLSILYFDEDLKLARTMTFSDIKKMGDRTVPSVARMIPADKPNEYTEFSYEKMEFNVGLEDSLFTLRNLQR